jgi:hypothetical protein
MSASDGPLLSFWGIPPDGGDLEKAVSWRNKGEATRVVEKTFPKTLMWLVQ